MPIKLHSNRQFQGFKYLRAFVSPPSSRMQNRFPSAFAEGIIEFFSVMEGEEVSSKWLSPVLVYSLQYLLES